MFYVMLNIKTSFSWSHWAKAQHIHRRLFLSTVLDAKTEHIRRERPNTSQEFYSCVGNHIVGKGTFTVHTWIFNLGKHWHQVTQKLCHATADSCSFSYKKATMQLLVKRWTFLNGQRWSLIVFRLVSPVWGVSSLQWALQSSGCMGGCKSTQGWKLKLCTMDTLSECLLLSYVRASEQSRVNQKGHTATFLWKRAP